MNFETASTALATVRSIKQQCLFLMRGAPEHYLGEDEAELADDITLFDILMDATEDGIDCWGIVNGEGDEGDSFSFTVPYGDLS